MDVKKAFLRSSRTIMVALVELSEFTIVGHTSQLNILSVHVQHKEQYEGCELPVVQAIRRIGPHEFNVFKKLYNESAVILAYSWLDAYLNEIEEIMYLASPETLGDSVQVKLGKILSSVTIDDLVHDIAKRKVREKGQWGLKNRLHDLRDSHDVLSNTSDADLEWMSTLRNNIVHNRRVSALKTHKRKVIYSAVEGIALSGDDANRYRKLCLRIMASVYRSSAKALGITLKTPMHRTNLKLIHEW